jgi:hypothetical protein
MVNIVALNASPFCILLCGMPATLKADVAGEGYLLQYSHESND